MAALLTLPPALATIGSNSPDAGEIAGAILLGVVGTAVAFVLYFGLIDEAGAGKAALCEYLFPPLALTNCAVLLDEEITPAAIGGLVLILIGVALASGERQGERVPGEPAVESAGVRAPRLRAGMVDTHFHLDHIEAPPAHVVSRARKAGVDRMLAIGMTGDSCRHALAASDKHEEIFVSVGRHPHESEGFDDTGLAELRELSAHPKARAVGEAGLDYKRDYAPRDDQRQSFIAQIELAKSLARPLVVHTREAADDTIELLDAHGEGVPVIIHCFSLADRVAGVRGATLVLLVRGKRHLSEGDRPAARRARGPRRVAAGGDGLPVPLAAGAAQQTERACLRDGDRPLSRRLAGYLLRRDGALARRQRRPPLRLVSEVRASLDRMSRHGIKPNRELGQNFLVDDNVLEVIGRTAELDPQDVVLEIGGGLGVLSAYLAPRSATCTWSRPMRGSSPCCARR